jgi:RNA polymerase sigma factor (sigma-70 family)
LVGKAACGDIITRALFSPKLSPWSTNVMNQSISGTNSPLQRRLAGRREQDVSFSKERSDAPLIQTTSGDPDELNMVNHPASGSPRDLNSSEKAKLKRLMSKEIDFISSPEFEKKNAESSIFQDAEEIKQPDISWYRPLMDDGTTGKPGTVKMPAKKASAVLTLAQERVLFLKFNYARFRQRKIQDKLAGRLPRIEQKHDLLKWNAISERYRRQIAETNLALVLAMAKRVRLSDVDFADLISEGNMALMRSVDKFDCERGFKFSTYSCRAILKAFSRQGMKDTRYRKRFPAEYDPSMERSDHLETLRKNHEQECAQEVKHIVINNEADLTEIELSVLELRFGVTSETQSEDQEETPRRALTLEQVGQIIGVTKERVRQIQNKSLKKIRQMLEDPTNPERKAQRHTTAN